MAAFYQVFVSEDEDSIFDQHYFETSNTTFDLSAALAADGYSLSSNPRWYWAILPVNEILDSPDINSDNFMIWRFNTTLETPVINIEQSGAQARIYWIAVPNAQSYKVLGCETPYGTFTEITTTGNTDYVELSPGTKKFFKVIAKSEAAPGR